MFLEALKQKDGVIISKVQLKEGHDLVDSLVVVPGSLLPKVLLKDEVELLLPLLFPTWLTVKVVKGSGGILVNNITVLLAAVL